jgi:hypothetical protein
LRLQCLITRQTGKARPAAASPAISAGRIAKLEQMVICERFAESPLFDNSKK